MPTVTPNQSPEQPEPNGDTTVVRSVLIAAGTFITAIASILVVAGNSNISDENTRFAVNAAGVIAVVALLVAAASFFRRR